MTENELLAALLAEMPQAIQPGDVTAKMLMDSAGISDHKAYTLLADKVAAGVLQEVRVRQQDGRVVKAWRKV